MRPPGLPADAASEGECGMIVRTDGQRAGFRAVAYSGRPRGRANRTGEVHHREVGRSSAYQGKHFNKKTMYGYLTSLQN